MLVKSILRENFGKLLRNTSNYFPHFHLLEENKCKQNHAMRSQIGSSILGSAHAPIPQSRPMTCFTHSMTFFLLFSYYSITRRARSQLRLTLRPFLIFYSLSLSIAFRFWLFDNKERSSKSFLWTPFIVNWWQLSINSQKRKVICIINFEGQKRRKRHRHTIAEEK